MTRFAPSTIVAGLLTLGMAVAAHAQEDARALFKQGVALVNPYITLSGRSDADPNSPQGRQTIARGIALLDRVTRLQPDSWQSYWFIGKAWQATGNSAAAYDAMKRSYTLQPDQPDVAREFVFEAICTSRTSEAVTAARRVLSAHPDDAGLSANLAVALLADKQLDAAAQETARALRMAPDDTITRNLADVIAEVRSGKPAPSYCAQ